MFEKTFPEVAWVCLLGSRMTMATDIDAQTQARRRAYDTDLSDGQWALIAPLIPDTEPGGRPRKAPTWELVNAVLFFVRSGAAWRLLPHDLPPGQTVYYHLRRWQRDGIWTRVRHALVMMDREHAGREASPTAGILDGQSVRTADQRGLQRLRCGQEDLGPQASHPDRHRRPTALCPRPRRRHPGPRWGQGGC